MFDFVGIPLCSKIIFVVADLAQLHVVTGLQFGIYMIKPHISEIFFCTNSLVNGCVVSKTCILPGAL